MYIIGKTPALPFIGNWVSATGNGPHVPPMLTNGGVPPSRLCGMSLTCRIIFKRKVTVTSQGLSLCMFRGKI